MVNSINWLINLIIQGVSINKLKYSVSKMVLITRCTMCLKEIYNLLCRWDRQYEILDKQTDRKNKSCTRKTRSGLSTFLSSCLSNTNLSKNILMPLCRRYQKKQVHECRAIKRKEEQQLWAHGDFKKMCHAQPRRQVHPIDTNSNDEYDASLGTMQSGR